MQFQYKIVQLSKFNFNNINKINSLKKIQVKFTSQQNIKYTLKNLLWLNYLIFSNKPSFLLKKIRRQTTSKTIIKLLFSTFSQNTVERLNKITNVLLPNLENRILVPINKNASLISFKNCLTHSETDLIFKNKSDMLIKKYNIVLEFFFKNSKTNVNFFALRFLQLPIKNV